MVNWGKRLLSASHCWGPGGAEMMKRWSCPQWALVQQAKVLVINSVQHLVDNNSHSLVKEFLVAPPFIGVAVPCRVIIACSKSQLTWDRMTVLTQVVRDVLPKNQLSSLGEIFSGILWRRIESEEAKMPNLVFKKINWALLGSRSLYLWNSDRLGRL